MTIVTDERGRYELGFPYRAWPAAQKLLEEAERAGRTFDMAEFDAIVRTVNNRFATDEDTARVVQFMEGLAPVYRSVYRFTQFDTVDGRPVKESAIVDKLFWEFEHQSCGKLCEHVRADVAKFINWLRRNDMAPWILSSGGKSLHVYVLIEPVACKKPHETVKRVLKLIENRARFVYADPNAMLGTAQMARVMNAKNTKTGLYAIPIRADEVLNNTVEILLRMAQKPRNAAWTAIRTTRLKDLIQTTDREIAMAEAMESLFPPVAVVKDGAMCVNIKRVYESDPSHESRGHKGLIALLTHCKRTGMDRSAAVEFCVEWNRKSTEPMTRGNIRYQAEWVYSNKYNGSACLIAVPFVGKCPVCCTRESGKSYAYE